MVVTYTVAVETEAAAASVSTLIEDSSTEDVSAAVKKAATEAGADEDFADVETTAVGTPTTALAPQPDDDAPTTGASEGSSGGGGGPDAAMSAGIGAVGAVVLLALFGGGVVWRRRRAKAALRRGGEAATLRGYEETGYDPKAREELLQRHKETTAVVERGMTVTSALLGAASGLPLVGPLCDVAKGILGDARSSRRRPTTCWSRRGASSTSWTWLISCRRTSRSARTAKMLPKRTCSGSSTY